MLCRCPSPSNLTENTTPTPKPPLPIRPQHISARPYPEDRRVRSISWASATKTLQGFSTDTSADRWEQATSFLVPRTSGQRANRRFVYTSSCPSTLPAPTYHWLSKPANHRSIQRDPPKATCMPPLTNAECKNYSGPGPAVPTLRRAPSPLLYRGEVYGAQ